MRDTVLLHGLVLSAQNVGEYNKRLVLLTNERGKITVFAQGIRRTKSPLMAAANPFVFGAFSLRETRDAYNLDSVEVVDYFDGIAMQYPGVLYGVYFLELAAYYGREGIESKETVNLLYVTLKSIMKGTMPVELIRSVFELRIMSLNGEYAVPPFELIGDANAYEAVRYSVFAPLTKLYAFELTPESGEVFTAYCRQAVRRTVDKPLKSLAVIEEMR